MLPYQAGNTKQWQHVTDHLHPQAMSPSNDHSMQALCETRVVAFLGQINLICYAISQKNEVLLLHTVQLLETADARL